MGQPANLPDQILISALRAHYGLSVRTLAYLPIGADSESAVYRVDADGTRYFLKLRTRAGFSPKSLLVPRVLRGRGLDHVPAPRLTLTDAAWVDLEGYALSLHDYIDGDTATIAGLSEADWSDLGATMRRVHEASLPPEISDIVPKEGYVPSRRNLLPEIRSALAAGEVDDPIRRELAAFWDSHRTVIDRLIARCDELAGRVRSATLPNALCHADLHTWNILVDSSRQFWIVDWDETICAPKERDLMFVIGGISEGLVRPHQTAAFLRGYGETTVDPLALAYYRCAWAVQDLAAYAEQAVLRPELGEASRREALEGVMQVFEPGQITEIASSLYPPGQ